MQRYEFVVSFGFRVLCLKIITNHSFPQNFLFNAQNFFRDYINRDFEMKGSDFSIFKINLNF